MIDWLRNAMMKEGKTYPHYSNGIQGCGYKLLKMLQKNFFEMYDLIISLWKCLDEDRDFIYLLNSLKWDFKSSDHPFLARDIMFDMHFTHSDKKVKELGMPIIYKSTNSQNMTWSILKFQEHLIQTVISSVGTQSKYISILDKLSQV